VHVKPCGDEVTVYCAGVAPDRAWAQLTVTVPSPGVTVGASGTAGRATGVTEELVEPEESPPPFVATTVNVYAVPLVKPVTLQVVAGCVAVHSSPPGLEVTV